MDKLKLVILNNKKIIIIVFSVFLIFLMYLIYHFKFNRYFDVIEEKEIIFKDVYTTNEIKIENRDEQIETKKEELNETIEFISIDIKGRVKKPGVYRVEKKLDRRISDIITMAGGLLNDADTSVTNLAKKTFDEMVIIIYSKAEVKDFAKTLEKENVQNDICHNECDSCIEKDEVINNSNNIDNKEKENELDKNKLININNASKEELMTLPGIGESKALAIIAYRSKTPFQKIEDIMNISGIKESAFAKIKDYITI